MLSLLRYDFNRNVRLHLVMILTFFLLIPLFTLFTSFEYIPYIIIIALLLSGIIYLTILIVSISTFNKTMFTKEGYFTHTLPYFEYEIILSKFLISLFWYLISFLTFVATFSICVFIVASKNQISISDLFYNLNYYLRFIQMVYANASYVIDYGKILSSVMVTSIFKFTSVITLFYFVLSLVNTQHFNKHKKLFSVIFLFVIYLIVASCSNYIFDHFINTVSYYSSNYQIRYDLVLNKSMVFNSISYLLQTILYLIGTTYLVTKKMEI